MRKFSLLVVLLFFSLMLAAADNYQKALITGMKASPCDRLQSLRPQTTVLMPGTSMMGMPQMMAPDEGCTAYELRTSKVNYRILTTHGVILPVGEEVMIRLTHKELDVRLPDSVKDVRTVVLEMTLLERTSPAEPRAARRTATEEPSAPEKKPAESKPSDAKPPGKRTCLAINGDAVPCPQEAK